MIGWLVYIQTVLSTKSLVTFTARIDEMPREMHLHMFPQIALVLIGLAARGASKETRLLILTDILVEEVTSVVVRYWNKLYYTSMQWLIVPRVSVGVWHMNCQTVLPIELLSTLLACVHKLTREMYRLNVFPQVVLILVLLATNTTFHHWCKRTPLDIIFKDCGVWGCNKASSVVMKLLFSQNFQVNADNSGFNELFVEFVTDRHVNW